MLSLPKDHDTSLEVLLISNLVTYLMVEFGQQDVSVLMWIYYFQTLVIGLFSAFRILSISNFTTEGTSVMGRELEDNFVSKLQLVFFFALHFGLFSIGVYQGLNSILPRGFEQLSRDSLIFVAAGVWLFFLNHLYSYLVNPKPSHKVNIGTMTLEPYLRIIPIHIITSLGAISSLPMLIFFLLKALFDATAHATKRYHGLS